jgi:hypothetical protein
MLPGHEGFQRAIGSAQVLRADPLQLFFNLDAPREHGDCLEACLRSG